MSVARGAIVLWIENALRELGLSPGDAPLDEGTGLLGAGVGLDSVEALQLVLAAEQRFGLTVEEQDLEPAHLATVGSFASFVEARLERGPA